MAYIDKMKKRLRLKSDTFNDDISDYINAALLEMKRTGIIITETSMDNALIFTCVEFYCKWMMNFEAEGEKYEIAFEKIRDSLSLSGEGSYYESNEQETNGF